MNNYYDSNVTDIKKQLVGINNSIYTLISIEAIRLALEINGNESHNTYFALKFLEFFDNDFQSDNYYHEKTKSFIDSVKKGINRMNDEITEQIYKDNMNAYYGYEKDED